MKGLWEFLKGFVTGTADFSDISDKDLESKNELRRAVAQSKKWGREKHPYSDMTNAEYLKKEADKIRAWYNSPPSS